MYHESDPLLPKDTPSPEIHGSRPQSINDVADQQKTDDQLGAESDNALRPSMGFGDVVVLFMGFIIIASCVLILFPDSVPNIGDIIHPTPRSIDQRVARILTDTPLIDGHDDLAIFVRYVYNSHIYSDKFRKDFITGGMRGHIDLPRLKKGMMGGAFWAAFVPCPADGLDFSDENYKASISYTYSQIDLLNRLRTEFPNHFSAPPNSSTALSAFQAGQMISPLAIEGLHQIGNSVSNLRNYFDLGVRYATLTHNCHNKYADAALLEIPGGGIEKAKPHWGGVSPDGRKLIHEMNRMGMIVDLSHVSYETMRDVLGGSNDSWTGSKAPPIFSHSSAYAICPHPRNVPDDILQLVKKRKSIVMVNFSPDFISCISNGNANGIPDFYPKNSTLAHVVEHIMHIGSLIGYDYVGIGSDFDGIGDVPRGLDDASKFPDLVAEMLRRGINDKDASKVVGGNILRVWKDVDAVAMKMQANGETPLEDDLPDLMLSNLAKYGMRKT